MPALVCFLLALAIRLLVAARVFIPGRDGATYLWMAERVAAGDFGASFQTVFPPVYPWTTALVLRALPGIDTVWAGQVAAGGLGALAVFPLWSIARRFAGIEGAWLACLFYAFGTWFARHPADCMSEGPFYLLVALVVDGLLRGPTMRTTVLLGLLVGLAFGTRPEGAGLLVVGAPWLWLRDRRAALVLGAVGGLSCLAFAVGYSVYGEGFTLTPKATFNWAVGAGRGEGGGALFYLEHLLRIPGHVFESVGYAATALAGIGAFARRDRIASLRQRLRSDEALLLSLFALQALVIPLVRSTIRFVSAYGMLLLPFAMDGVRWVRARWWPKQVWGKALLVLVAFGPDLARIPVPQREDKTIERDLGAYLRERMQPGELLASAERRARSSVDLPFSMCRIEFFVGQQPAPPRPLDPSEVLAMAGDPRTRFCLIAGENPGVTPADVEILGFRPHELPPDLAARAAKRSIAVFERPR